MIAPNDRDGQRPASAPSWFGGDSISISDRGLQFGDGLFETLSMHRGQPWLLAQHLDRLRNSCLRLSIDYPEHKLNQVLNQAADYCQTQESQLPMALKLLVTRGNSARGYQPDASQPANLYATLVPAPYTPQPWHPDDMGVVLQRCTQQLARQPNLAGLKHLNRLEQTLARLEWQNPEIFDGLMLDTDDHVVEGVFSNLILLRQGELVTPSLAQAGVQGVVRQWIMTNFDVAEIQLPVDQLEHISGICLCNSLVGVRQVREIRMSNEPTFALSIEPQLIQIQKAVFEHFDAPAPATQPPAE